MLRPYPLSGAFIALVLTLAVSLRAASEWHDVQGASFKADPVEPLGPYAAFQVGATKCRLVLFRGLIPADCVRFSEATRSRPPRAASFADAKGRATSEVVGRTLRLVNGQLAPADLRNQPEPEILVVLYGFHNHGESWQMMNNFAPLYQRAAAVYPGLMEAVYVGVGHKEAEHRNMATGIWMPWLVADFQKQSEFDLIRRFTPTEGGWAMVFSRDGTPLLGEQISDLAASRQFADRLIELLSSIEPTNPRSWPDRLHYANLTRPSLYPTGDVGPELIGNPLRASALRPNGIERVEAQLSIDEKGAVTSVELAPASVIPDAYRAPFTDMLRRRAVFAPALHDGKPVASTFHYLLTPTESTPAVADQMWMSGTLRREIAIPSWLVLSPVPVAKEEFSEAQRVDPITGKVTFSSFEVTANGLSRKKQLSAFSSDWFAEAGAATVHPTEGATQVVDEKKFTWRRMKTADGFVDLRDGEDRDYCIGYAWTEIEVPAAIDAYLGIGSDEGLKIWLNGTLVHDKWMRRQSRLDDDVIPLKLKAGRNSLLIKIQNATGDWSFVTRLRTR